MQILILWNVHEILFHLINELVVDFGYAIHALAQVFLFVFKYSHVLFKKVGGYACPVQQIFSS